MGKPFSGDDRPERPARRCETASLALCGGTRARFAGGTRGACGLCRCGGVRSEGKAEARRRLRLLAIGQASGFHLMRAA